jgi:uncharacterized cupin superfamily protein
MPKIDIATVPASRARVIRRDSTRPSPAASGRGWVMPAGSRIFYVNLVHLPPDNWSSQRHGISHEDEFVYVLEGELCRLKMAARRSRPAIARLFPRVAATAIT